VSVIVLQVFVSLILVAGSIVLFVFSVRQRDYEHADRLALAPLANDTAGTSKSTALEPSPPRPPEESQCPPIASHASNTTTR
jgi:hypothetical protein